MTNDRIGPFYNGFDSDRLIVLPTGGPVLHAGYVGFNQWYFSYKDAFANDSDFAAGKTPVYAYFSSYNKSNGYNRYLTNLWRNLFS